jgi:hypothetical protein
MTAMLEPEVITAVERHKVVHDLELCTCPCFSALLAVAKKMPDLIRAVKLEGVLAAFEAMPAETEEDEE